MLHTAERSTRSWRGEANYRKGCLAEDNVAQHYEEAGYAIRNRRWRCPFGELDLIASQGPTTVIVEVKSSRTHERAAESLGERQQRRIRRAADFWYLGQPFGSVKNLRVDLALVDSYGRIEIREHVYLAE